MTKVKDDQALATKEDIRMILQLMGFFSHKSDKRLRKRLSVQASREFDLQNLRKMRQKIIHDGHLFIWRVFYDHEKSVSKKLDMGQYLFRRFPCCPKCVRLGVFLS